MNIIGQSVPGYPLDPYTHPGYHPPPPPGLEAQNTSGSGRYLAQFSSELYTNNKRESSSKSAAGLSCSYEAYIGDK